jgi:hypothetical protein
LEEDEKKIFGEAGEGFEAGMKVLWEKFDARASQALIHMGIYFSRFLPPRDQSDCYSRLVIALRALDLIDCVQVATLNYECLFEVASSRVGVNVNMSGEPNPGTLSVTKPHGSCNFLAKVNIENITLVGEKLVSAETEVLRDLDEIEPKFKGAIPYPRP